MIVHGVEKRAAFTESEPTVPMPQTWEDWITGYEARLNNLLDVVSDTLRAPQSDGLSGQAATPDASLLRDIARVLEVNEHEIFKTMKANEDNS